MPYLTGEKIDQKNKIEAVFSSGTKFKPRELTTIKACFDLKQNQQKATRSTVANYLHLPGRDDCSALELRKALDKVDYDFRKIKDQISRNFNYGELNDDNSLQEFELEHITDVFKTYAYFGLYPHIAKGNEPFISYLSNRLDKYP